MRTARLITLATIALVASAATTASAEWRRLDSPNFVVVGDVSERTLKDIAVKFEGFRETLSRVLTERATSTAVPTIVIVFPSDRAFTPYKSRYQGKPVEMSGVFVGRPDANFIGVVADGNPEGLRVVFHEYAHLVVSNVSHGVPTWLNEGVAEYYSTYELGANRQEAILGRVITNHLLYLNQTRLLPLDDLLAVDHSSPFYNEKNRRSVFYAQSWALVHLLLQGKPNRMTPFETYIDLTAKGTPSVQAWRQAFAGDDVAKALDTYIGGSSFQAYKYKFTGKVATFDATPVKMSAGDAEAFLSLFLTQLGRADEAADHQAKASAAVATEAWAQTTGALLDLERRDHAAASKRLMALGTVDDWLTAYLAGVGIANATRQRRDDPSPQEIAAVRKYFDLTQKTRGDIPNAIARFTSLALDGDEPPSADTRAAIERARTLAPGRYDYVFLHSRVLASQGDFAAARSTLGPLMSTAYPPDVREYARSLMSFFVGMEQRANRGSRSSSSALSALDASMPTPDTPDDERQPGATSTLSPFRPIYRKLEAGEERVEGTLTAIECTAAGSAVFHVETSVGETTARAPKMQDVDFIAYRDDLTGTVSCGPFKPAMRVYMTSKSGDSGRIVVAIEFLPR